MGRAHGDTHAQALPYATGGSNPGLADPREACYSRVRALPWTGPRYVMSPLVPEFTQKSGRDAFVANHQMPPFEKADWKGNADMAIETKYGYYEAAYAESAANIAELNAKLLELDPLICCTECATEGGFSYDDVDLWARLRSLTLIKGIELPPKTKAYLDHYEKKGDVPLYYNMAI